MIANLKRYAMRRINLKPMAQQTAVEWYTDELLGIKLEFAMGVIAESEYHTKRRKAFEQAKQMEKEQIIEAACYDPFLGNLPKLEGEKYYNETYKTK
jgi:hypothetical protein